MRHVFQHMRRTRAEGQAAVGFLVVMGFMLILVGMVINLGQMAQVRVETSNIADGGALAGASWMASGQNEAAWIARKMWDGIALIQAIYLVPFCPDSSDYAIALWNNLAGVNGWFTDTANNVMAASWRVGARETLTASYDNAIIRFSTMIDPANVNTFWSSAPAQIEFEQRLIENNPIPAGPGNPSVWALKWTNGLVAGDPGFMQHKMSLWINYPPGPTTLNTAGMDAVYYQWGHTVASSEPGAHWACDLPGWGIISGPLDRPKIPVALMPADQRSGKVNALGVKQWDFDLGTDAQFPSMNDMSVGACPGGTCGMDSHRVSSLPLAPLSIADPGGGLVGVWATHEVVGYNGLLPSGFPDWTQRFPPVTSTASARYTTARVDGPPTLKRPYDLHAPTRDATARLDTTH